MTTTTTTVFRLFGLVIWSCAATVTTSVEDEEAVYLRMSARFADEMGGALNRVARPQP